MTELAALRQFFELSSDLLCVATEDGHLKLVNSAFSKRLGYSREELLSQPFLALVCPEDRDATREQFDQLLKAQAIHHFENRLCHRDGSLCWLEWNVVASPQPNGEILFHATGREITQRKQWESRQQSSQAELAEPVEQSDQDNLFYSDLFQHLPMPLNVWQLVDENDARSLTLCHSNPAAIQATGIDGEAMRGQIMLACFPGVSEVELERYAQVARGVLDNQHYQLPYFDKNGLEGIFEMRLFALPPRCVGIAFNDITQAVRLKQQLKDNEENFRTIFEQAAIGMARIDVLGQWLEVNDRFCQMLNYSREELLSKTFADITDPRDAAQDEQYYQQLLSGELHRCSFEKRYLRSDGSSLWVTVAVTALQDHQGQVESFIATIQDISDRKDSEIERKERASELRRLNQNLSRTTQKLQRRNRELDQFAYVVSHDLKAPLRALSSLAGWIAEDNAGKLAPESERHLELLQQRVMRMGNLLDGLLDYSRIGRVNAPREQVAVGALLANILDSLQPPAGFQVEIVGSMPTVEARTISLTQVFTNLISNAIRYCDRPDGHLRISVTETPQVYEFSLADNGPGIDPQYHERIFEIFQTLQPRDKSESTGVGLSIVKKILTVEQGDIWLKSLPGQGTTFYFSWPKSASLRE